jgi:hypothetical protein
MDIKPIVGATIGLGATSLMLESTKMLPKMKKSKTGLKMSSPNSKKFFKTGTKVLIGSSLLGTMSNIVK